jgi:hypothetical protein
MWRFQISLVSALLLAGCAQLPPTPEDIQARKMESVPDKAVIYIVRQPVDSDEGHTLSLDDRMIITTYKGTYYRWEVAPGIHRVSGFASGTESVTLNAAPGRIYFVQHTVVAHREDGSVLLSALQEISDQAGRNLVSRGRLLH